MKASKEVRILLNKIRSRHAKYMRSKGKKPNGSFGYLDIPWLDVPNKKLPKPFKLEEHI